MLNFTVYIQQDRSQNVGALWRIHAVNPPDLTFRGLYTIGYLWNTIMQYPPDRMEKAPDEKLIFNE